jgi:hypothetical protein
MKTWFALAPFSVVLLLLAVGSGCEVESASQVEILLTPSHASVRKGDSVQFTASGWHEYNWSLTQPDWGVLSHRVGDTTVYTATVATNGTQTLTVSATVSGTNTTTSLATAAMIEHR